jgi:hypothetical protein
MAAAHGTRTCYTQGCHCEDCTAANAAYQQEYRQRLPAPTHRWGRSDLPHLETMPCARDTPSPGPVELGVRAELEGLSEARPGLAQVALALARILDNPKAVSQKAAAAKVLAGLLEKLRSVSAKGRQGGLAVVRAMAGQGGA